MEQLTEIEETTTPRGRTRHNGAATTNVVSIGPRDSLIGNLTVEGDVRVEGTVEGEIHASGDIDIETAAIVRARLEARNVSVRGNVTGNVVARKRLNVGGSGIVSGDVRTARLRVDDGATVNGGVTMGPVEDHSGSAEG